MKTIDPGRMNQRIQLQQRAAAVSADLGEPAGAWQDVGDPVWAQAEPLRGREFFAAGQMQSTVDVRFRIHWRADVAATWRVVWNGLPYDITGHPIDVGGRQQFLELMCTHGVRDGRA